MENEVRFLCSFRFSLSLICESSSADELWSELPSEVASLMPSLPNSPKPTSDKLQWMAITQIESVNNYSTAVIHIVGEQASRRVSKGALVLVCVAITWLWQPPLPLTQNYCAPQLHEDHHHHHEAFKTWFIASIQSEQVSTGQRKCEKISDEFD